MRVLSPKVRFFDESMPVREVFRLASIGNDFQFGDFGLARKTHAHFLSRIGHKVFDDIHRYRQAKGAQKQLLGRILLQMRSDHHFVGKNAPAGLQRACLFAFGPSISEDSYHIAYKDAAAAIGSYESFRIGMTVCGVKIRPRFGVFAPSRPLYCEMFERVLPSTLNSSRESALEIGTGTGVLALLLAKQFRHVTATDVSHDALACAADNFVLNGVESISLLKSDLFEAIPLTKFDCIVFNPPW